MRFDGWTVSLSTGELERDGRRQRLAAQPLAVLSALLERPGELVTREELIGRLWPRGVVEFDTALNTAVRRLRHALDDHAETPRYIETIPKRGYRFIGQLETDAARPPPVPSVAPDPARARRVRSWAMAAGIAIVTAGALLLAMGTVATSGVPVVGAAAARDASARLGEHETYTVARYLLKRRAPGDLATARRYFERVTRSDPSNADAWAGLAGACWLATVEQRIRAADGLPCVRDAASAAVSVDPGHAEAHLRLSNYYAAIGQREKSQQSYRRAVSTAPEDPLVLNFRASIAASDGRYEEAADLARRAVEADPLSSVARWNRAAFLFYAGRGTEVREALDELRDLRGSLDDDDGLYGRALLMDRRYAEALQVAQAEPGRSWRWQVEAMAMSALGRSAESASALHHLQQSGRPLDLARAAEVHTFRGDHEDAFAAIASATSSCRGTECDELSWQLRSPLFDPLHADARWRRGIDAVDRAIARDDQRLARNVSATNVTGATR